MSLVVAGTVAAIAAYRSARSGAPSSYYVGTDVLGAESPTIPPVVEPEPVHVVNRNMYTTQVAAGITVLAIWAVLTSFMKRSK